MVKKVTSLLLSAALFLGSTALPGGIAGEMDQAFTITAKADNTVIYDGDTMADFSSRTPETIAKKYTDAFYAGKSYVDGDASTYYVTPASVKSPYNEGVLTEDTLKGMQEMTNFYRWLVGSKPLAVICEPTPSLQYQALDRNFEFNHYISQSSKPADMPQELWDKGFECTHNILAGGFTPLGSITGWMNEGYFLSNRSWSALGHREVLIHPDHVDQQFGYSGSIGIGVCNFGTTAQDHLPFYAFPAPSYNPSSCIIPKESAWTIGLDLKQITYADESDVKITVTNLSTGTSYDCTLANDKLKFESRDFIGFVQPSDYNTATNKYDKNYKVVVTGLVDKASSKPAQVQYTVKFFELKDYAAGAITKAGLNFEKIKIYNDTFDTTDALKKLGACLPQYVTITNEFGSSTKVKTKGAWILDKAKNCWYNSVNSADIPVKYADTAGLLDRIEIKYEYTDDPYCQYNTLTISPSKPIENSQVKFTVYRTYTHLESSALCQITEDENGGYICKKTYSSLSSPEFDKQGSGVEHYYYIDASPEDSGQYISIYYSADEYWKDAYVCVMARSLSVTHSYTLISQKDPSCTQKGEKVFKCSVCGDTYTEYSDALGHSYTGKPVDATCTEQGYTRYTCTRCGDEMIGSYTPAKGHTWGSWNITTPATCTADGVQTHSCSVCHTTETQTIIAQGHKYPASGTTVAPTCTEQGYTCFTCSACGNLHKTDFIPAKGHSWGSWTIVEPASCSKEGLQTHSCTVCNVSETQTIPKLDHRLTFVKTVEPTCEEEGYDLYTCANCGQSEQRNKTKAKGHNFGDWIQTQPATCAAEGIMTKYCTRCNKTETQPIAKLDHDFKFTKTVDAGCTEGGYSLYTCANCQATQQRDLTSAKGHSWGDWSITQAATCTKLGIKTKTCSRCGDEQTEYISTIPHSYTSHIVPPSCTEKGYTEYTCTVCGDSYKTNYVTQKGHSWSDWTQTEPPSCTQTGIKTRTCTSCGKSEDMQIAKLAHSYKSTVVPPSCTAQGYTLHTCTSCGDSYKDSYTSAVPHSYGNWITITATPAQSGGRYRVCTECGNTQTELSGKTDLRLAGNSRYDTAFAIADRLKKENGGKAFENIIIASGTDFADALSATYLAKTTKAPILITSKADTVMSKVDEYIKKNAASNATVYIIGGESAVSAQMEQKLSGFTVKRLAGRNRYLTNLAVLKETKLTNEELLVAFGGNYADALSSSAVGKPIFLVAGSGLTADQKAYLSTLRSTTATIIGGTGAVSAGIEKELKKSFKTVNRLGGANRFETSVLVAQHYFDDPPTIALAYGLNFPDGLCGGPLAMTYECPLILTVSNNYTAAKAYAKQIKATSAVTFGGSSLITDAAINGILGK